MSSRKDSNRRKGGIWTGYYIITGTLRNGKRFKAIRTQMPQCYNIYSGTVWYEIKYRSDAYSDPVYKREKAYDIMN